MAIEDWRRVAVVGMGESGTRARAAGILEFGFCPDERYPDRDNDKKFFVGYVFERHADGWWIAPDTWSCRQDQNIGPYESMEDAYAALEIMVRLKEAPVFDMKKE